MNKRYYIWGAIILVIALLIYRISTLVRLYNKSEWDFKVNNLNILNLSFSQASEISVNVTLIIKNNTSTSLVLRGLSFEAFYNGKSIAKTQDTESLKKVEIKPYYVNNINSSVDLRISSEVIGMLTRVFAQNKTETLQLRIGIKLLGIIPLYFKYPYELTKSNF